MIHNTDQNVLPDTENRKPKMIPWSSFNNNNHLLYNGALKCKNTKQLKF